MYGTRSLRFVCDNVVYVTVNIPQENSLSELTSLDITITICAPLNLFTLVEERPSVSLIS